MLKTNLPVLVISDTVLFPLCEIKIESDDNKVKKIATFSENYFNNHLLVVFSNNANPKIEDLPNMGVIALIKMKLDMPNGKTKLTLKGLSRGSICDYHLDNGVFDANIVNLNLPNISSVEALASGRTLKKVFIEYLDNKKGLGNSIVSRVDDTNDLSELTDIIAGFIPGILKRKVAILNEIDPLKRVEMLMDDLHYELSLLEYENSLDDIIEHNLEEDEKKFILNQKLKVIQEELGIEENSDVKALAERIEALDCPIRVKNKLHDELNRYKLCNSNSPEIGILRNYIDTLLSLPWNNSTREIYDIDAIKKVLDENHYGIEEVKQRIIEFVVTKKHTKIKNNPIICLVGPPGIGKTSLAKSISVALKRKCVKISVGGINDEAEITGHRRAYVGALPGKIITGIIKAGVNNPVFIIDEIDKMTKDIKGDPASSLLEALDKEQNERFVDHFVEEEFDLSKVMFILTANYLNQIPFELRDRLEIIELSSYTIIEKCAIVKNCLLKKLRSEYHLLKSEFDLDEDTIKFIINNYTRESGVRELERILRSLCRKYIYYKLEKQEKLNINKDVEKLLGKPKYSYQDNYENSVGCINVLSFHPLGGELLKIESTYYPGEGKISCTGSLGDVMKESIELSLAYIKSHVKDFNLDYQIFKENDFFVHVTNEAIKKDGPSAGVNVVTSILSLLKNKTIPNNISMSGELSLSGKILQVGGLKEKIIVALKNGIKLLYLPKSNEEEVLLYKNLYDKEIKIKFVDNYFEIYNDLFKK